MQDSQDREPTPLITGIERSHRSQSIWQIYLPVVLGAAAIIALMVLLVLPAGKGDGSLAIWSEIATLWLLLPVFGILALALILLCALIYGVGKLTAILPRYSHIVQSWFALAESMARRWADVAMEPVLIVNQLLASLAHLFGLAKRS